YRQPAPRPAASGSIVARSFQLNAPWV
ncbi:MAG: hypothetical protein RLZZ341_414, partial [Pseudomonadota bacterium]